MSRLYSKYNIDVIIDKLSQGYSHSVEECKEIIGDYEIKDQQVLNKITNLYMGRKAFIR
jgi:hypothetical protein